MKVLEFKVVVMCEDDEAAPMEKHMEQHVFQLEGTLECELVSERDHQSEETQ